ncbi:SDR family oxidoreductase [Nocardia sp. CDC160]|uniref:SDR family oxidoreductase n=1 Tax=Nocardia sp. CDC160 TaxID=3112166 RepID=UPI002DC006BA|nr:SDR family oxidoreductase [Nocardia sp. CDC160]MEC3919187.1 SDR family oxidoreductase [Nocardia sp. CDC160]
MTVLVSGLSGQLGHAIAGVTPARLIGLVRPSVGATRLRRRIESRQGAIELVTGDISVKHWGVEEQVLERLAHEVTCVVNCAGSTDWMGTAESLQTSNVAGAVHGVGFARRLSDISGRSIPYLHTSTTYVAGSAVGTVPETRLAAGGDRTRYEHFKWVGEEAVLRAARTLEVPVLIARFPALLGDSTTGETLYKNSLYLLAERWNDIPLGLLPAMHNARVDCMPRDKAAEILLAVAEGLAAQAVPSGIEFVHIANGAQAPTLRALVEAGRMVDPYAFDRWIRIMPASRNQVVNASALGERFARLDGRWQNALIGLRYIGLDRIFDRSALRTALDAHGKVAIPPVSLETAARLTFGLDGIRESISAPKHRPLARFRA